MANDALPLPDISAGPPDHPHDAQRAEEIQDAEYEAIHAEIAATERGRWFLNEHVKRNPAADTDRLVGSLARAEAALRGGTAIAMPRALADDLAQLAAAIRQIEAVIAANAAPVAGGLAAGERIQDIAFALRERETDSTLCEALEVALFELGEAFAQHDAAADRAQSAAALLRGLEASINAMITLAEASPSGEATAAEAEPPALAAVAHVPEPGRDDSETESLRAAAPVEPPAVESVAFSAAEPSEPPAAEAVELHVAEPGPAANAGPVTPTMWETPGAAAAAESRTNDLDLSRDAGRADIEEGTSDDLTRDPPASAEILRGGLSDETVTEEALAEALLLGELASIESPTKESAATEPSMTEPPVTADSPSGDIPSRPGEESVPADLMPPASSSPVMQTAALQVQPAPVTQAMPRPPPNDPLAALRALSKEELIALFS